jgi:hypothetical protein
MNYIGDFAEDSTVRIALTTNNGDGARVAPSSAFEAADFVIYKNGSATQKATTNGITCTSPFDSVVGLHTIEIDTSNDTGDSGFWTTGADYWVIAIPDKTVDSQTVIQVVAVFSIQNRYMRGTDGANTTTPPTAAANATAVRSELTTELARIDVATSTRLASASYSAPPSAATVADAVWDEVTVDHTSTGSFGYVVGLFFQLIENVTGWRFTTKALEQAPGGSASGSGARTVTVTVNDGTTALQNARVRMTEGANSYSALTNASGVAVFNLDDATYTVAITKAGYSYAGTTLVVDGNETITYSMSLVTITPSNSPFVTGYYTCYSELGVVESGVTITLQVHKVPSETGLALDSAVRTTTSDSNGLAQFTNLVPGTTYLIKRGSGTDYTVKIADNATGSVELNSILGT